MRKAGYDICIVRLVIFAIDYLNCELLRERWCDNNENQRSDEEPLHFVVSFVSQGVGVSVSRYHARKYQSSTLNQRAVSRELPVCSLAPFSGKHANSNRIHTFRPDFALVVGLDAKNVFKGTPHRPRFG